MWTTLLAYTIAFMGFVTFGGSAIGTMFLFVEDMAQTERVPLRHYAAVIALVSPADLA